MASSPGVALALNPPKFKLSILFNKLGVLTGFGTPSHNDATLMLSFCLKSHERGSCGISLFHCGYPGRAEDIWKIFDWYKWQKINFEILH